MWMSRKKYPIAGTTVPVLVEPADTSRVLIVWDEIPTIDEWISTGHPVFTDPDAIERVWREASRGRVADAVASDDAGAAAMADRVAAPGANEQVRRAMANVRAARPQEEGGLQRRLIEGPSARVLALGLQNQDGVAYRTNGEMLLSVYVPGQNRYGVRWHGPVPQAAVITEWWDLPVDLNPRHPDEVKIRWGDAAGLEVVADRMHAFTDRAEAMLSNPSTATAGSYAPLLAAIADPVRRGQAESAIRQALDAAPSAAAPDPLDELARLGQLRAAGAITGEEFAARKTSILARM